MTDAEITAAAQADADDPPLSEDELARVVAARRARGVRVHAGLSQAPFAEIYHISLGRLRDLEQGCTQADSALLAYLAVIEREPEAVRRALQGRCRRSAEKRSAFCRRASTRTALVAVRMNRGRIATFGSWRNAWSQECRDTRANRNDFC